MPARRLDSNLDQAGCVRHSARRVAGFLVACVRNQAISQQRAAVRLAKLSTKVRGETIGRSDFRIEDYIENRRLYAAFMSLPEEQRVPLLLSYFLGKTHVEISQELGLSLGTTKSRISLGLRKLGKALKARVTL